MCLLLIQTYNISQVQNAQAPISEGLLKYMWSKKPEDRKPVSGIMPHDIR